VRGEVGGFEKRGDLVLLFVIAVAYFTVISRRFPYVVMPAKAGI
jgi:hypothetical protein